MSYVPIVFHAKSRWVRPGRSNSQTVDQPRHRCGRDRKRHRIQTRRNKIKVKQSAQLSVFLSKMIELDDCWTRKDTKHYTTKQETQRINPPTRGKTTNKLQKNHRKVTLILQCKMTTDYRLLMCKLNLLGETHAKNERILLHRACFIANPAPMH